MSETDSFIEEVSEEVRRDKLFGLFRKYGWIAALVLILIVGGSAYNEYSKAQRASAFQDRGDALLAAITETDPQERLTKLSSLEKEGGSSYLTKLFRAQTAIDAKNPDEAIVLYDLLAEDTTAPEIYRDMATLKSHFLTRGDETLDVQTARLDPLTVAGRPFRLLALEARAIAFMEAGQSDAAQEDLSNILLDPETQQGLSQRAQQLILLMGGELPEMPGLETSSDATQ